MRINYRAAIGLGNLSVEYDGTRHNLGGRIIQFICSEKNLRLKPGKGHYYYSKNGNLILVYPTTFMNDSGIAAVELYEHFSLSLENILIILDDISLPFGKIRLRREGSDGGHKGLYSIIYNLNSENIPRLRIGIGSPRDCDNSTWVLSKFSEAEEKEMPGILKKAKEAVLLWQRENIEMAMSKINGEEKEVK